MNNAKKNGFTLIELIISIAILGVILTAFVSILNISVKTQVMQTTKAENQININYAQTYIRDEIRNAEAVDEVTRGPIYTQMVSYLLIFKIEGNDKKVLEYHYHEAENAIVCSTYMVKISDIDSKRKLKDIAGPWSPANQKIIKNVSLFEVDWVDSVENIHDVDYGKIKVTIGSTKNDKMDDTYVEQSFILYAIKDEGLY